MKVTKKTRLLAKPKTKVNLTGLYAYAGEENHLSVNAENIGGISGYFDDGSLHGFDAKMSVNGGEPFDIHAVTPVSELSAYLVTLDEGTLKVGDTVKMTIELDPTKASEYEAGTMELTTTVVSNV